MPDFSFLDKLFAGLYILAHTYTMYGPKWMFFFLAAYVGMLIYLAKNNFVAGFAFVTMLFASYFASELIVNQRVLTSAGKSTRTYATLALTVVAFVFLTMLMTGDIEPYQGAIVFVIFYIIQARYRTSTLTMTRVTEQTNAKNNKNNKNDATSTQVRNKLDSNAPPPPPTPVALT